MTNMIDWQPPASFNPEIPGLGQPTLDGLAHTLLHDPLPSRCNLDDGGDTRILQPSQAALAFDDELARQWARDHA